MFDTSIIGFFIFGLCINTFIYRYIDNKTKYIGNKTDDWDIKIILVIFIFVLGPIMLLFKKQIKLSRKHTYLKKRIQFYQIISGGFPNSEINRLERIYKISKIHQQSK